MKHTRIITSITALAIAGTAFTTFAIADEHVKVGRVQTTTTLPDIKTLLTPYRTTPFPATMPRTIRHAAATGSLKADFSVQDGASQTTAWSEGFDGADLSAWVQDQGENNQVTFSLKQTTDKKAFSAIDADDKTSLYIDGPINITRRTIGTLTSGDISVPANAQFHAYTYFDPMWNEYATLSFSVSTDGFETQTELWNSTQIADNDKNGKWRKTDIDMAAFAGKDIKLRITYGPGTKDGFNVGGYLGSFYVDGMSITGVDVIDQIKVKTGDVIQFTDLSAGTPTAWQWSFPGGTPETSTEQAPQVYYTKPGNYDVTLKVTNADGEDEVKKTSFVSVEGQAPQAAMVLPADFRELSTRMHMVAPLAKVHFADASTGYPDRFSWAMYSEYEFKNNTSVIFTPSHIYTTKDADFNHEKTGKNFVTHIAQNDEGYSFVDDSLQVQFDGYITNFEPDDGYQTNFTDGDLTLPGSNKLGITAWAEKFSKPSTPMILTEMYVNFTKASSEELTDQIANVTFSLYSSKDGMPGERIDMLDTWTLSELNYALTTNSGIVTIELSKEYIINDEFFVVIEGIPEKSETTECAFAMAPMRDHGNTAYMLKNGKWQPFTGYFQAAPGGQTSLAVFPVVKHSVMVAANVDEKGQVTVADDRLTVGKETGSISKTIFSKLGWKDAATGSSWCRITNKPGEYTADNLEIAYDALPDGMEEREGFVEVTDGVSTLKIYITQQNKATDAIDGITADNNLQGNLSGRHIYDLNGRHISSASLAKGIYIVRDGNVTRKVIRK